MKRDRFRTTINVWGDAVGTGVVAYLSESDLLLHKEKLESDDFETEIPKQPMPTDDHRVDEEVVVVTSSNNGNTGPTLVVNTTSALVVENSTETKNEVNKIDDESENEDHGDSNDDDNDGEDSDDECGKTDDEIEERTIPEDLSDGNSRKSVATAAATDDQKPIEQPLIAISSNSNSYSSLQQKQIPQQQQQQVVRINEAFVADDTKLNETTF